MWLAANPLEPKLFQQMHEIHKLTFSSDCTFDILWSIPTISGSMESSLQDEHSHTQFAIDSRRSNAAARSERSNARPASAVLNSQPFQQYRSQNGQFFCRRELQNAALKRRMPVVHGSAASQGKSLAGVSNLRRLELTRPREFRSSVITLRHDLGSSSGFLSRQLRLF